MPMKRLLFSTIFLSLIVFYQASNAQNLKRPRINDSNNGLDHCGTVLPPQHEIDANEQFIKSYKRSGNSALPSPVVIPIKAHIVRNNNGTGGVSLAVINNAIVTMNTQFSALNMSFTLCGSTHYIDDSALYSLDVDLENGDLVKNNVHDAINIYFVGALTSGASTLYGISAFPSEDRQRNRIIMENNATMDGFTLGHEMGHYWNLYHTHETALGSELVNGSNCTTAGDLLCDTPADPCCRFYTRATCTYTGTVLDANGQAYSPSTVNLMSYYLGCMSVFTSGQIARMEAGYSLRNSYMAGQYNMECRPAAPAVSNLVITQLTCGVTLNWADNASNEMGYIVETSTSASGPWKAIANLNANSTSYVDQRALLIGATYHYRIATANSNTTHSPVVSVVKIGLSHCYCLPESTNCSEGDKITNVSLKSSGNVIMSHNSDCESYSVITPATIPTLIKGNTYTVSATKPLLYNAGLRVWIDYNRNGVFETGEAVATRGVANWTNTGEMSFTIGTIVPGQTRMRVRLQYNTIPATECATYVYGETEDYIINLTECPVNITHSGAVVPATYKAQKTISSTGTISNTTSYAAGEHVELLPGFNVNQKVFEAKIQGCL